jgi:hypothetical protein
MTLKDHGQYYQLPEGLGDEIHEAQVLTQKLCTRVVDSDVRGWITEVVSIGSQLAVPGAKDPDSLLTRAAMLSQQAQERMGEIIRSL